MPLRLATTAGAVWLSDALAVLAILLVVGVSTWQSSKAMPLTMLAGSSSRTVASPMSGRLFLVTGQVAISMALVVVVALAALKDLRTALAWPLGFAPTGLLSATVDLTLPSAITPGMDVVERIQQLRTAAEALPGIQSAALSDFSPLSSGSSRRPLVVGDVTTEVQAVGASDAYFHTLGIRLLAGRALEDGDQDAAVVSRSLFERLQRLGVHLGDRVVLADDGPAAGSLTIVGVADDVRHLSPVEPPGLTLYLPALAQTVDARRAVLLVRTAARHVSYVDDLRRAVAGVVPHVPIWRLEWLEDVHTRYLRPTRVLLTSLALGAAVAVVFAMTGTYALLSYLVTRRRREVGIRAALGTSALRAYLAVAKNVVFAACAGLAVGAIAGGLSCFFLLGVTLDLRDAAAIGGGGALVTLLLAMAVLGPAMTAARLAPADLMREVP